MPSQWQFLDQLKQGESMVPVELFELPVSGQRMRDLRINALVSSGEIFDKLKRFA